MNPSRIESIAAWSFIAAVVVLLVACLAANAPVRGPWRKCAFVALVLAAAAIVGSGLHWAAQVVA